MPPRYVIEPGRWSKVDALFQGALDCAPEERSRWLEEACNGDEALQSEVLKLLALAAPVDDRLVPSGAMAGPIWEEVAAELAGSVDAQSLVGERIADYEMLTLLGSGGMGHVYRARDHKLGREVAVKALSGALAEDTSFLRRFEREARLLASLNHPNIASIYDFLFHEGKPYLILELVPGETLDRRLLRGALVARDVAGLGLQIAGALEEAHRKGITHRDLKPGNVKVTPDGRVKVLDFGLAKADVATNESRDGSITTRSGLVLGTAPYMSPEQARGEPVDNRTDIWAFGCLLYELLSGVRAFRGPTVSDILASVLKDDVDWSRLPGATPQPLRRLVRRCLEKDSRQRLQDIGDARIELEEIVRGVPVETSPTRWHSGAPWALAFASLVAAAGAWWWAFGRLPPAERGVARLSLNVDERLGAPGAPPFDISPDGRRIVYAAERDGKRQLFLRDLASARSQVLAGTEGAFSPFFSTDGARVGFFSEDKLKIIQPGGGAPVTVAESGVSASQIRGASWSRDDQIAFARGVNSGLFVVRASGGSVAPLTSLDVENGERSHRWPFFLPDGDLLFTVGRGGGYDKARIDLFSPSTGTRRTILDKGTCARFLPTGHLILGRDGALAAVRFDVKRDEVVGMPVPLLDDVRISLGSGALYSAVSENGSLVYAPSVAHAQELVWVGRDGRRERVTETKGDFEDPAASPDGSRIAVSVNGHLWIADAERGTLRRLTFESIDHAPVWTPDGKRIYFASSRDGPTNLYTTRADGSDPAERITRSDNTQYPCSWSPDGKVLAFVDNHPATRHDIWLLPLGGKPQPFLATPFDEVTPSFSPDGRWLTYASDESGSVEVYVQAYPRGGAKLLVSTGGGRQPIWSPSGRSIFYVSDDGMVQEVDIDSRALSPPAVGGGAPTAHSPEARLRAGKPRALFPTAGFDVANMSHMGFDVTPDGRRFVMVQTPGEDPRLNVILDWFSDLEARLSRTAR